MSDQRQQFGTEKKERRGRPGWWKTPHGLQQASSVAEAHTHYSDLYIGMPKRTLELATSYASGLGMPPRDALATALRIVRTSIHNHWTTRLDDQAEFEIILFSEGSPHALIGYPPYLLSSSPIGVGRHFEPFSGGAQAVTRDYSEEDLELVGSAIIQPFPDLRIEGIVHQIGGDRNARAFLSSKQDALKLRRAMVRTWKDLNLSGVFDAVDVYYVYPLVAELVVKGNKEETAASIVRRTLRRTKDELGNDPWERLVEKLRSPT